MSRVGKQPITIPAKVKVELESGEIKVSGPHGSLSRSIHPSMQVKIEGQMVTVERPSDNRFARSLHGLTRMLIANMVKGVSTGFEKILEITGVGYRAEMIGKHLKLLVGYSHPLIVKVPPGIVISLDSPTRIKVWGSDKELVGMIAAKIRSFRPPEPYKGKGIRYESEHVRRKAGKTAA